MKYIEWRSILFSWVGRSNIVKMSTFPKIIFRFNAMPIKISKVFNACFIHKLYFSKYVLFKLRNCFFKDIIEKKKSNHFSQSLRKDHCNTYNNKGLVSGYVKNTLKTIKKKPSKNPVEKWAKDRKRHFTEEETQMTKAKRKKCQSHL